MNSRTAWIVLCVVVADLGFLIGHAAGTGAADSKCELEVREHEAAFLALWDRSERELGECESRDYAGVVWEPTRDVYEAHGERGSK
jgi:hypothetical protein